MELITCLMVTEPLQLITSMLPSVRGVHKFSDADNITTPYRVFFIFKVSIFCRHLCKNYIILLTVWHYRKIN